MNGRVLVGIFLAFLAVFAAVLVYFQFFAYYERDRESTSLNFGGRSYDVAGLDLIGSDSSPLKLRACFDAAPDSFAALPVADDPVPLTPPPWFDCFDPEMIDEAIRTGEALAYTLAADEPDGFDTIVASFPDGRVFLWRQLNEKYR